MKYELTTIVPDEVTTNPAPELIASHGGSIIRDELLGTRKFAYPIKQRTNGVYTRFLFELDPAKGQLLDHALRRHADIIRHLIVLQPREVVAPTPQKVEMSDEQIAALGDVKEMQAAEEKARAKQTERQSDTAPLRSEDGATEGQARAEEPAAAEAIQIEQQPPAENVVIAAAEQPAEAGTAGEHVAVKDESEVDEATRQAALDEKLKSILGK